MAATDALRTLALTVGLTLGLTLGSAAPVDADERVTASTHVYTDDDRLTVVHPAVRASVDIDPETRVDAAYEADIISAATIDVRTSASVRPFQETRHGGRAALTRALARTVSLGGGYGFSYTPDYQSHSGQLRLQVEDDSRIHMVTIGLQGAHNAIGRVGDPSPEGELVSLGLGATWAVVLARWLVVDASLALEWRSGYQENPYRFVAIHGPGQQRVFVPEAVPDERTRGAASLRLRAALTDEVFARASYRFHADDWGIAGHTVRLEATYAPLPELSFTVAGRILVQRAASFYSGHYESRGVPLLRTRDRELAAAAMGGGGIHARWRFLRVDEVELSVGARVEVLHYRYFDTPLLPERNALVTGLTLLGET